MNDVPTIDPERVLVLAPTAADATLSRSVLAEAGLACHVCADLAELSRELDQGAGAVLSTEEMLAAGDTQPLMEALRRQPPWSDVPIILLCGSGADSPVAAWAMELLGNVTVLERPVRLTTLISTLQTAIRARRRQYELGDKLEELRRNEERFHTLSEIIPSIVWTAAPDGTITYANQQWLRYTGLTPELNTREWPELVLHPDDKQACLERWARALREGTEYEVEVRHRRHDGAYRWFVTRAVPLKDGAGRVTAWFGVTTDIHEQKELHERLRDADRRKDEFLATLAHELRNPLAPIRNALHIMRLMQDDRAAIEQSRMMMERQLGQLARLIDDLFDASRIAQGKLTLHRERVDLESVVMSAVETARPYIEAFGHELTVVLPPQPVYLDADPVRLAQAFSNLLNNAAKYTDRGGQIWLTATCREKEVIVTVRDTGMGVPANALPSIFDMFTQIDRGPRLSRDGLGIGLALVKRLVEMHGGTVAARSEGALKGSEFSVRLTTVPATTVHQPRSGDDRRRAAAARRRVLVADDNKDTAESLGTLLRMMGNEVHTVYDGAQAVEEAAAFRPDVVLLDVGMPRLNGYDAARRIRDEGWGQGMVLVALTGWGQEEDKHLATEAGFDRYFTKPVNPADLVQLVAGLHDSRRHDRRRES